MEAFQAIGIAGSILLAIAFIPQCYKMLSTRSAKDISIYYLSVIALGSLFMTVYGYGIRDLVVFGLNLYAFLCNVQLILLKLYFDRMQEKYITKPI